MKIISDFKDYYDFLAVIYGIDETRVWKRMAAKEELQDIPTLYSTEYTPSRYNKLQTHLRLWANNIWFCDKNYPIVRTMYGEIYANNPVTHNFWSLEELLSVYGHTNCLSEHSIKIYKQHFAHQSTLKFNSKYGSPQLIYYHRDKIRTNIRLKDYDFQRVVPAEQAFQRICMWLSAKDDVPQTIPTDMNRFEAKGFDKKTSFRKM